MPVATLEDRVAWLEERVRELMNKVPSPASPRYPMRVLFTLVTVPGPNVGSSSLGNKEFTLVSSLTRKQCEKLGLGNHTVTRTWRYRFDDGWSVCIKGRTMQKGERTPKSEGFLGYEWMVTSIVDQNEIKTET